MKTFRILLIAAAVTLLPACFSISKQYVQADKLTFEAIAPEYQAYVEADPALDEAAKERRIRTIQTWRFRIEAGE